MASPEVEYEILFLELVQNPYYLINQVEKKLINELQSLRRQFVSFWQLLKLSLSWLSLKSRLISSSSYIIYVLCFQQNQNLQLHNQASPFIFKQLFKPDHHLKQYSLNQNRLTDFSLSLGRASFLCVCDTFSSSHIAFILFYVAPVSLILKKQIHVTSL